MKKWLGIFIRNEYLCSQVNAGVHRTYSMFVMILEKSPKQEGRGGEYSPPLILYIKKGEGKEGCPEGEWKDFLFMIVSILPVSFSCRNNQGII